MKKYLVTLLILCIGLSSLNAQETTPSDPLASTRQKLAIVLPDIDLKKQTLSEALSSIAKLSAPADPKKVGINFMCSPELGKLEVSLSMTKPTIQQALDELCKQTKLQLKVEPYAVFLVKS